jgi:hypothetical protein
MLPKPRTAKDAPMRDKPNIDICEPPRIKLRKESEEPMCATSNTDSELEKQTQANIDSDAPNRLNDLKDTEDPT